MGESPSSEAIQKDEVQLSPEQKQVVGVMGKEGVKLETAELDARERAAGQLKALHGKELVDAGLKQMGHGVWETVKSEVKWAIGGGLVGGIVGTGVGLGTGRELRVTVGNARLTGFPGLVGAGLGAMGGRFVGYETAGIGYNKKVAPRESLPPARWYDWVVSHGSGVLLNLLVGRVARSPVTAAGASFVLSQLINPISAGGMRNVATGLWQMRTPDVRRG